MTEVISTAEQLIICATSQSVEAACPACHEASQRVHSYYQRSPRDLPVSGRAVQLRLRVRRFRCLNGQCSKQTFAEPLPDLIAPIARRTNRLTVLLGVYAIQSGGEPGARLLKAGGIATSPDTLLRLAKVERDEPQAVPSIIGVDDFAFRRGHTYGAILVDLLTHRPVELLADRSAETFARWLESHPGVEWISRDRSKEFARGARLGAPQAQQILDRWHVLMNMREVVERALNRLHPRLSRLSGEPESAVPPLRQRRTSTERARSEGARQRRLALYEQVVELYKQGEAWRRIARQLGIGLRRVRTYVRAGAFPERARPARTKSAIDSYRGALQHLWEQGCHTPSELWQHLAAQGFSGGYMLVYRWVQLQREVERSRAAKAKGQPALAAPRHLAWLLVAAPAQLDQQEHRTLALIRQESQVETLYQVAQQLRAMVKERNAASLQAWLDACIGSQMLELEHFAHGLQNEFSALQAALTLPYSNGPVEGVITKVKCIRRSMYGRGSFPLLRQRVLQAA